MDNHCNCHNRRKYRLKVYTAFATKYYKQLLKSSISEDVRQKIFGIAKVKGYEIIAMETNKDHTHFLLSYDTIDSVPDIIAAIKQQTAYSLLQKYGNFLSGRYWKKKIFWSDGFLPVVSEKYLWLQFSGISKHKVCERRI